MRFLYVSNFQLPRIVNRLEPRLETVHEPPQYLIRRESRNGLAHALGTREFEQRAFLPGIFQNAFVHIQGNVAQERGLICVQRNIPNWVFYEESGERDEKVFLSGGEVGGDLNGHSGWVQGDVSDYMVPYLSEMGLSRHLQEGSWASFTRSGVTCRCLPGQAGFLG